MKQMSEAASAQGWPRLLVIDSTRAGALNATGQQKSNLLAGWPDDLFLQIWARHGDRYPFGIASSLNGASADRDARTEDEALHTVSAFRPDIVYYRPTIDQHAELHRLAWQIVTRHSLPLVSHIVDDWPSRLIAADPERGRSADRALREILGRSHRALAVSDKMAKTFAERYGVAFEPIANGIEVDRYRDASAAARAGKNGREEVVLRYCGALAKDMTFDTVVDISRAVDTLSDELPIRFEVYTMEYWRSEFEQAVEDLRGVSVFDSVPGDHYPSLLADADILVLGYGFDPVSLRYIQFSMPNKLPEYLGSGAAVFAVGPSSANGIDYLLSNGLGCCVTERDEPTIVHALRTLALDRNLREHLGRVGQRWAFEHLDLEPIARRFQAILKDAASVPSGASLPENVSPLIGPLPREKRATIDESRVIARLLAQQAVGTMLDVGAHHGSALRPFVEAGWSVVAAEPDSNNRRHLIERFGNCPNISIDSRAVSDQPAKAVAFFSSEESTGISALHAFRESHRETAKVEVTTVAELIEAFGVSSIDFLKIDVEGHDLNVLQGVPWHRIVPEVIECEFEDAKTLSLGHTYRDIADYLVDKGYTLYLSEWHPIIRYGVRHEWRQLLRYPATLASPDAWGNILAFRTDPGAEAVKAAFVAELEVETESVSPVGRDPQSSGSADVGPSRKNGSEAVEPQEGHSPPLRPRPTVEPKARTTSQGSPPETPNETTAVVVDVGMSRGRPGMSPSNSSERLRALPKVASPSSSAYERFYVWAKTHNPLLFAVGRAVMWCARKARSYPLATAMYLLVFGALVAGGFLAEGETFRSVLWVAGGTLGVLGLFFATAGFTRYLVKEAHHELAMQDLGLRRRIERVEQLLSAEPKARAALGARLDELQAAQQSARTELEGKLAALAAEHGAEQESLRSRLAELLSEISQKPDREATAALGARLDELQAAQQSARTELEGKLAALAAEHGAEQESLRSRLAELLSEQQSAHQSLAAEISQKPDREATAALEAAVSELRSSLSDMPGSRLTIDIVSALRQIHRLWVGEDAEVEPDLEAEKEHGHVVLMALLVEEARRQPGALKGRTLVEVGTTREHDPHQGSTEKLAIFTGLTGMRFISVDMDPMNTAAANRVIPYLNPAAKAVTDRGESYLAASSEPLDYVYLDAFDFDHGQHSEERKARYRDVLDTEISDEACWQMHQLCAAALITKMPKGGIVVIDDTWVDDSGEYAGKGRLAVPLLQASGFEEIAKVPRALALKRTGGSPPS